MKKPKLAWARFWKKADQAYRFMRFSWTNKQGKKLKVTPVEFCNN